MGGVVRESIFPHGGATRKNWRRGRDSNPRYPLRYVRFRGGSFQPLTHLSEEQLSATSRQLSALKLTTLCGLGKNPAITPRIFLPAPLRGPLFCGSRWAGS